MQHAKAVSARAIISCIGVLVALSLSGTALAQSSEESARVRAILKDTPLIDGHNDWAEALREREGTERGTTDLRSGLDRNDPAYNTDIARLRAGMVGGQFWSVWVSAEKPGLEQVQETLEQIDLVKQIVARYPKVFALARTAEDVRRAHKKGLIASMIGVEGGGQIDGSLSVLRAYHDLGAMYLTLTHSRTISWADSATDNPQHGGLTTFGETVVRELNRLGMLVDLSHVSEETMIDALRVSRAPVIFSHSSARALVDHPRNVSDAVLRLVAANGGVVMINFSSPYVSEAYRRWSADAAAERTRLNQPPYRGLYVGQPEKAKAAYQQWLSQHPAPRVTIADVADHIEHVAQVAGVDHVGLGADFDGVDNMLPEGLSGVDTYPALLEELMHRGWSDGDIAKLSGENILRVMADAKQVARATADEPPANDAPLDAPSGGRD